MDQIGHYSMSSQPLSAASQSILRSRAPWWSNLHPRVLIADMYDSFQKDGPSYAKGASGLMGSVNMTLPRLTTMCSPAGNSTVLQADISTVGKPNSSTSTKTLDTLVGSNAGADFSGATCIFSLCEVLLPNGFWYNGPSNDGLHLSFSDGSALWNLAHGDSEPKLWNRRLQQTPRTILNNSASNSLPCCHV